MWLTSYLLLCGLQITFCYVAYKLPFVMWLTSYPFVMWLQITFCYVAYKLPFCYVAYKLPFFFAVQLFTQDAIVLINVLYDAPKGCCG